jgi:hypothetical protein
VNTRAPLAARAIARLSALSPVWPRPDFGLTMRSHEAHWDTIRFVLEEIEGLGEQQFHGARYSYGQDTPLDETVRVRHLLLLRDAGYIKGVRFDSLGGGPGIASPELTWEGHELLDTIRSRTVKSMAKDKGLELSFMS